MMAHNDLGAQLLEQGNLDESTAELRRAIAIDAKAFNPYLNLGIVLIRQKRSAEAADTLRKTLSLESDSAAAQLYLGVALMNLNDLAGAGEVVVDVRADTGTAKDAAKGALVDTFNRML